MTVKKQAARRLWNAGVYLERQATGESDLTRMIQLTWAMDIIASAYNQVLGEPHVSRSQPIQR